MQLKDYVDRYFDYIISYEIIWRLIDVCLNILQDFKYFIE